MSAPKREQVAPVEEVRVVEDNRRVMRYAELADVLVRFLRWEAAGGRGSGVAGRGGER